MTEHLGNAKEFTLFTNEMKRQLEMHKKDKISLKNWSFESVMLNNCPELTKRVMMIDEANVRIKNNILDIDNHKDLELIAKQSVHIANYSMMCYLKAKEELQSYPSGSGDKKE